MRKILMIAFLLGLTTAIFVGCGNDDTFKPVITRIEANVDCGYAPVDIQFAAFVSGGNPSADPTGANTNVTLTWDFDDGGTGSGSIISHRFLEAGEYEIFATVTDDDGDTDRASIMVELLPDSLFVMANNDTTVTASKAYFETPTLGASNGSGGTNIRQSVVINEILAFNVSAFQNPVNAQYEPVLELYNPTDQTVPLANWSLSNDTSTPRKWVFPSTLSLAPGGYQIIWVDNHDLAGANHTNFWMTGNYHGAPEDYTGSIYLYNNSIQEVDRVQLLNQRPDVSFGHIPDGCDDGLAYFNVRAELCGFDPVNGLYERFDFHWDMDDILGTSYPDRAPSHIFTTEDAGDRQVVLTVFDTFTSVTRRDTVIVTVDLPE